MDAITREDLKTLLEQQDGLCLSIYLPTVRAGDETQQNPIRYKNLLRRAEERLVEAGLRLPEAQALLEPLAQRIPDADFWRHQGDGLAAFAAPGFVQTFRLPRSFRESVFVSRRFHIKPLLPLFTNDGHFYILALSQNRVRLLEGWRDEVRELELADVPTSLAEALRWDERENQVRWHTVGGSTTGGRRRQAMFHGQGGAADDANVKEDILRFFQKVDEGLKETLEGERIPLVLAGVEYLHPIYREASHYPYLADKGITGNADDTRAEELHARAWEIVSPRFRQAQADAAALYRQQAGTGGRASQDLAVVVPAAYYGRAGTLFVREGARRWGLFDPQTGQVTFHDGDQPTPDDTDLLDFAAAYTYLNNGEVYVVRKAEMPADSDCAAVLRY